MGIFIESDGDGESGEEDVKCRLCRGLAGVVEEMGGRRGGAGLRKTQSAD